MTRHREGGRQRGEPEVMLTEKQSARRGRETAGGLRQNGRRAAFDAKLTIVRDRGFLDEMI